MREVEKEWPVFVAIYKVDCFEIQSVRQIFVRQTRGHIGHELVWMPIAACGDVTLFGANDFVDPMLLRRAALATVITVEMPFADQSGEVTGFLQLFVDRDVIGRKKTFVGRV